MTRLVTALLAALNRHRKPPLPQRKAAASAARRERIQQQRAQRDDARIAAVLDQWTDDMRQEGQ